MVVANSVSAAPGAVAVTAATAVPLHYSARCRNGARACTWPIVGWSPTDAAGAMLSDMDECVGPMPDCCPRRLIGHPLRAN